MKFSTPIFALVATSAVYANSSEGLINFLKKREVTMDESAFQDVSEACNNDLEKYEPCLQIPTDPNSEICQQITSDECKNFFSNAQSLVPSCKDYPQVLEIISPKVLEGASLTYGLICAKDETGKPCPLADDFANSILANKSSLTGAQAKNELMATCSSNACRTVTYDALQKLTSTTVGAVEDLSTTSGSFNMNNAQSLLDFLNSNECKNMANGGASNAGAANAGAVNVGAANAGTNANANAANAGAANGNAPDANSGSSSLKIGTGLFVSLGLLLLSLY